MTNWFKLENSKKLEEQTKYFIASTVEGYLNGCYDCPEDYKPMTIQEWIDYVWSNLEYEKNIRVNGNERKHLNFIGKEKFIDLVKFYLNNYADVKQYIK